MDGLTDDELRLALGRLARRIRANRSDADLSDTQLSVLFHLEAAPGAGPSELAELEHVTPPSMNRTLNGLEQRGLVERIPDSADARRVTVVLTDAAHGMLRETRRLRTAWFTEHLASLTEAERAALEAAAPVIRKLADS